MAQRIIFTLALLTSLSCSSDRAAPAGPAGKATTDDLFALFEIASLPDTIDTKKVAKPDSVDVPSESTGLDSVEASPTPADPMFDIELVFTDAMPDYVEQAVREGAQMWEKVVVGDLPDTSFVFDGVEFDVEDVTILASLGCDPNNKQGGSSYAYIHVVREKSPTHRTTALGRIVIGSYYACGGQLPTYPSTRTAVLSRLRELAGHEIGHVLGLTDGVPDLLSETTDREVFIGEQASTVFGGPVPIMPPDSRGYDCSCHWDGNYFADGIMNTINIEYYFNVLEPRLNNGEPYWDFIADVEVAALADMGYQVDYTHVRKSEHAKYRSNAEYFPVFEAEREAERVAGKVNAAANAFHCAGLLNAP